MALSFFILTARHKKKSAAINGYLDKVKQAKLFKLSRSLSKMSKKKEEEGTIQKSNIYSLSKEGDYEKKKTVKNNKQ